MHCRKLTARFFVKLVAKKDKPFLFWALRPEKKGTDSSRAQCVHPPVNWISTQKSSKGIESKSTKFDLAAKAPEKLQINNNRKPDRLPTTILQGRTVKLRGCMRHLPASTRPRFGSRRLRWCHVAVSHQLPIATEQHLMMGYGLFGMLGGVCVASKRTSKDSEKKTCWFGKCSENWRFS